MAPSDSEDTYAVTDETYNKGGYRSVENAAARLAIPAQRRKEGMLVKQLDNGKFYVLKNGIADAYWEEEIFGSTKTIIEPLTVLNNNTLSPLTNSPLNPSYVVLTINGLDQQNGVDFIVSDKTITWSAPNAGFDLVAGDLVTATYEIIA